MCQVGADEWVLYFLGECAYSSSDVASVLLGYTSILFWVLAQVPQLWMNYKRQSADSLSLIFLVTWFSGDLCNLIGGLLTKQLPFQIYLASYFVLIDASLYIQVSCSNQALYYRKQHLEEHLDTEPMLEAHEHVQESSPPLLLNTFIIIVLVVSGALLCWPTSAQSSTPLLSGLSKHRFKGLLQDEVLYQLGRIFAWTCTCLYLSSRFPQIYWNYRRRSVEGLSIEMFGFAVMGNITYALSLLVKSSESKFLLGALPYLLGTAGTVSFDFVIFGQYVMYKK